MTRTPATSCTSVCVDSLRDWLGAVPPTVSLCNMTVETGSCKAGRGRRPLWVCPGCRKGVLLLYVNAAGIPACSGCHRLVYPSSHLRRTFLEAPARELRRKPS